MTLGQLSGSIQGFVGILLVLLLDMPAHGSDSEAGENRWQVRIGAVQRGKTDLNLRWDRDSIASQLPENVRGSGGGLPPVGPADDYANRTYVDGYVRLDPGTQDPETDVFGLTWNWGYQEAQQYTGNRISFRSASVEDGGSVFSEADGVISESDTWNGVKLALARELGQWKGVRYGFVGGFVWYVPQQSEDTYRQRGEDSSWYYVDTYEAPYQPFPSAPYSGSLEGPGYLLNNIPTSRTIVRQPGRDAGWEAVSTLQTELEILEFRVGLETAWEKGRMRLGFAPQVVAARVNLQMDTDTTIGPLPGGDVVLSDGYRHRDWTVGLALESQFRLRLFSRWSAGISAEASWWPDTIDVRAEPFTANLDLGEWTFGADLGVAF